MIVGFEASDATYAELLIKLKHEGITKREFFRGVVSAFLADEERFGAYIIEFKKKKNLYSHKKQKILDKERKMGYDVERKMGLSQNEIDDLFDMFDEELGV